MSPEHAQVFIAEDTKRWRRILRRELKRGGHDVVLTSSTLAEALKKVKKFKAKNIQVAVIDGNMSSVNSNGGQDGQILVEIIRTTDPAVKIIGMSSHTIEGADENVLKGNERILGRVVKDI